MDTTWRLRHGLALLLLGLALAGAGCGSESNDGAGNAGATTAPNDSKQPAGDKEQLTQLVRDMQQAFTQGHGDTYCALLTPAGQAEIVRYAKMLSVPGGTCQAITRTIARQSRAAGLTQEPTRVLAVRVRGQRATVLVRISDRFNSRIRFVKQDGDWLLSSPGLEASLGS
jgi:hypothetical protein